MFPSFEQWCNTVLHPDDTSPWDFRTPDFYEEYRTKYVIAKLIHPKQILEIGVRFGYSARSFLMAAPWANYFGIDFDEPSPCQCVPREWAEAQLKMLYPQNGIRTEKIDTQKQMVEFPRNMFDLVHIDADHSFEGALHDMQAFWPSCRNTMVVDDAVEVRPSIEAFKKRHQGELVEFVVRSLRSSSLLVRVD